jgi:uncharacterized phage protein (TIGR02218 family)
VTTRPGRGPGDLMRYTRIRRLCWLLEITRTDGVVFRFTDHDRPLVFEGETYSPMVMGALSNDRREAGFRAGTQESRGVIDGATVTFQDIEGSRFLGAEVRQVLTDWAQPWMVQARFRKWIRTVTRSGSGWSAAMETRAQSMQRPRAGRFGGSFGPKCPYQLGGKFCKKDISEWTLMAADHLGTSTAASYLQLQESGAGWDVDEWEGYTVLLYNGGVGSGQERIIVSNTADTLTMAEPFDVVPVACDFKIGIGPEVLTVVRNRWEIEFDPTSFTGIHPDGFYRDGTVEWTTGANAGTSQPIVEFTVADRYVKLLTPTPFTIEAGDRAIVRVGCDGLLTTCRDKFANQLNHGGDPFAPSAQQLTEPPEEF